MANIHRSISLPVPLHSSDKSIVFKNEAFTIWMKSLVLHGNGCTIYDCKGQIVYRVDNYDSKCAKEVYIMDYFGKLVVKIYRRKFRALRGWEGYRYEDSQEEVTKWFRVKRIFRGTNENYCSTCEVRDGSGRLTQYKIDGLLNNSSYKIVDLFGEVVAEVKRKETATGVALSLDVLSLVVAPKFDHSLVMALVVVHGLMSRIM